MTGTVDLEQQVSRMERGFPAWSLAESAHAADCLRRAARDAGRMPAAHVATAYRDALLTEGRGVMLAAWMWSLREALAHVTPDRTVGDALVATVQVRYAA